MSGAIFLNDFVFETLFLKNAFSCFKQLLFYDFLGILVIRVQKAKKVNFLKIFCLLTTEPSEKSLQLPISQGSSLYLLD
jgi:hypothetical protein